MDLLPHLCSFIFHVASSVSHIYIYVHTIIEGVSYRILQQHCHFSVI